MRKQIQQENIASAKVPTKKNIANLLTKPLYGDLSWQHMTTCLSIVPANFEI